MNDLPFVIECYPIIRELEITESQCGKPKHYCPTVVWKNTKKHDHEFYVKIIFPWNQRFYYVEEPKKS